jgi:hypothetical protein
MDTMSHATSAGAQEGGARPDWVDQEGWDSTRYTIAAVTIRGPYTG